MTDVPGSKHHVDVKGLRATGCEGWFGRCLRLHFQDAFLHFDAWHWARHGHSSLWLAVYARNFENCTVEPDCLRATGNLSYQSKGRRLVRC